MKLLVEPRLESFAVLLLELTLLLTGSDGTLFTTFLGLRIFFLRTGDEGSLGFSAGFPGYKGLLFATFTLNFLLGSPFPGTARLLFGLILV